jgi:hypothetical protein
MLVLDSPYRQAKRPARRQIFHLPTLPLSDKSEPQGRQDGYVLLILHRLGGKDKVHESRFVGTVERVAHARVHGNDIFGKLLGIEYDRGVELSDEAGELGDRLAMMLLKGVNELAQGIVVVAGQMDSSRRHDVLRIFTAYLKAVSGGRQYGKNVYPNYMFSTY